MEKLISLLLIFIFTSCKTFYIPIDSFKQQLSGMDSSNLKRVEVRGPNLMTLYDEYLANPIVRIYCVDKNNNPAELDNGPAIQIRFTYGPNNRRTVFYFDRIFVTESVVVGVQSRYFPDIRKRIPLNTITKIEIQEGKKGYHYIERK